MLLTRKSYHALISWKSVSSIRESGMTLVELLVVLAIIAGLAGLVYPAIMDSIKKSQASMAAQRIDAVEKAKIQYRLDYTVQAETSGNGRIDLKNFDTRRLGSSDLSTYLTRFGQPITSQSDLDKGTGGKININSLSIPATFTPDSVDAKFLALLQQYGVTTDSSTSSGTSQ